MKYLYTLFMLCLLLNAEAQDMYKQLLTINSNWAKVSDYTITGNSNINTANDNLLIKEHLRQIVAYLSGRQHQLTGEQYANRNTCIEILKRYTENGVFPVNTRHTERQPYFIDDYGTYCAVGYLISETGYDMIAQRIHKEMNYAYIHQIPESYIAAWANENGFTIDELALIQPSYAPVLRCYNDTFFVGKNTLSICPMLKNDLIRPSSSDCAPANPLIISILSLPSNGNAELVYTATDTFVSYQPDSSFVGLDSLKYRVVYGDTSWDYCLGRKDTATVYFNVISSEGIYITYKPGDADYSGIIDGIDLLNIVRNIGKSGVHSNSFSGDCELNYGIPWSGSSLENDPIASDLNNDGIVSKMDIDFLPSCSFPPFFGSDFDGISFPIRIAIAPYDNTVTNGESARFKFVVIDNYTGLVVPLKAIAIEKYAAGQSYFSYFPNITCLPVINNTAADIVNYSHLVQYPAPYHSYNKLAMFSTAFIDEQTVAIIDTFSIQTDPIYFDTLIGSGGMQFSLRKIFALTANDTILQAEPKNISFYRSLGTSINHHQSIQSNVSPNPTTNHFTLTLNKQPQSGTALLIHDGLGRMVKREELVSSTQQISVVGLPDGLYTYTITQNSVRQASGKLVIAK